MNKLVHINWEDAYCVGNKKIDTEHERLFQIAKEIYNCKEHEKILDIIKELVKYTKFHFSNEENFMKSLNYQLLEEHQEIHKQIVSKLNNLIKNIDKEPNDIIIKNVSDFIFKNLLNHILTVDKKFVHLTMNTEQLKKRFFWKDCYKIGNEKIDEEHKQLFDIAVKALDYKDNDRKKHIKETVQELYSYMKSHFEHEEKYMTSINYPESYDHTILHEKIIEEMNNFLKSISKMSIEEVERRLIEYIDIWLINHILYEDRKIIRKPIETKI